MQGVFHWIKEHPVTLALGLGGLLLVYVVMRAAGGGSSSGTVAYQAPGPSDAAIQAGAAVTLGQQQLSGQGQQLQAELAATNTNASRDVTIAGLQAQVAQYQTEQQANVSLAGIDATKQVNLAGQTTQQIVALANDATQASIAQLSADVTKTGYTEQTKQLGIVTQGYTDIAKSNNDTQLGIIQSNNSVVIPLEQVRQKEQETADYYQYKNNSKGGGGILGGIIGGIASLF